MPRILSQKEVQRRTRLQFEIGKVEDQLNQLISKAHDIGMPPDVSINVNIDSCRPIIKVWLFRDGDSIRS